MQFKVVAFIALGGLALAQEGAPPPGPETVKVARGIIQTGVPYDGAFEPVASWPVRCRLDVYQGTLTIAEVAGHAKAVKTGDVLIRFDAKKVEDLVLSSENELAAARAGRDRAEEEWKLSERGDRLAMEAAEREARQSAEGLDLFEKVDLPLALKEADLDLQRSQNSVDDEREELEQLEKMYKSEELTSETADIVLKRARRRVEEMTKYLEMTKERTTRKKEHDLPMRHDQLKVAKEVAAFNLEQLQKTAAHARHEKEAAKTRTAMEVARQQDNLARLKADAAALTVRATADGTLYFGSFEAGRWAGTAEALKALRPGETVQAAQVAMTVVGPDLDARIEVPEKDLNQFTGGADAVAVPAGFPALNWKGTALEPAPIAVKEGVFEAKVRLGASAPRVVAGMKCKVTVQVAAARDVLVLPLSAVMEEDGRKRCMLKGAEKPVEVKTGRSDAQMVEILEGLKEGDEVILAPKK